MYDNVGRMLLGHSGFDLTYPRIFTGGTWFPQEYMNMYNH